MINPYLLGLKISEDIEARWNKGRFGKEWEQCQDPEARSKWDLKLGQGRAKILEVRRSYSDRFFIEQFLTEELVKDLDLYLYEGRPEENEVKFVVTERDWQRVKDLLVKYLSTYEIPLILLEVSVSPCYSR